MSAFLKEYKHLEKIPAVAIFKIYHCDFEKKVSEQICPF